MMAIEVVQSLDETGELIAARYPASGEADLKLGAQVIVRESQSAVFFRGGKALDTFGPGRHTLTTANLPLLGKLITLPFGGKTPFKAEVVYVNHKVFTNLKWGTREPIPFRDTELQLVRLRAFGIMSFKVEEAQLFVNKIVGTQGYFSIDQIADFLKGIVIGRLTDFLGENVKSVFDLAQFYDEIGAGTKTRLKDDFGKYGMALEDFIINAITPPEEVQKKIDERSGMAAMGNLDDYMKYKAAQALHDAAKAEGGGGMAAAGMGAGVGLGLGMMMPGMVAGAVQPGQQQQQQPQQAAAPAVAMLACPKCNTQNPQGTKFCSNCGEKFAQAAKCPKCSSDVAAGAKFCANCGNPMSAGPAHCSQCGNELAADTKFCANCGTKTD
ncbi:MAG: SPFH domain-containing protein [Deltaproteobacteria bacterium]|nr:SPFH domain-containing protein [Deltaproteobacteria bacterium]